MSSLGKPRPTSLKRALKQEGQCAPNQPDHTALLKKETGGAGGAEEGKCKYERRRVFERKSFHTCCLAQSAHTHALPEGACVRGASVRGRAALPLAPPRFLVRLSGATPGAPLLGAIVVTYAAGTMHCGRRPGPRSPRGDSVRLCATLCDFLRLSATFCDFLRLSATFCDLCRHCPPRCRVSAT
jgi:hypothetical protein